MNMKKTLIAAFVVLGLAVSANAETVGAGVSILDLDAPNIQVDTPTNGENDQSRQNLDISFTATLGAGEWQGTDWTFRAGQTGSVIPYLAVATDVDKVYEIVAVGNQVDIGDGDLDADMTLPFGGAPFTVGADTVLYGGIVNPMEIGSQNPVYTNLNSGSMMDHDNNNDGMMSPAVVGGSVEGFGHANLPRSYAFSIDVERVPEPSAAFSMVALLGLGGLAMRRRLAK